MCDTLLPHQTDDKKTTKQGPENVKYTGHVGKTNVPICQFIDAIISISHRPIYQIVKFTTFTMN